MTIQLPQELVEEIIDHLADDFLTLKACSLVSTAWVRRCRFYLFESCTLRTENHGDPANVLTFRDLLRSPGCTFRPHVRTLHSVRYSWDPNDGHFEEIAADLRCLTSVVKFVMDAAVGDATASALIGAEFFRCIPQVTHLVLDYYFMGERPVPLIGFICLFPALQQLQIFTMAGNWAVPPLGVLPPKDLHTLVLRGISPSRVLAWLLAYNHLPNVDSLTLDRRLSSADVSTVRVALDRIGGALHHLDIDLGGLSEVVFDFSLHRNLRTLVIHSWDLAPNQMMVLVDNLAGLPLERLTFDIDLASFRTFDWGPLDEFLSVARFPLLRSVEFMIRYNSADEHEFMRQALPWLEGSGRLQLKDVIGHIHLA